MIVAQKAMKNKDARSFHDARKALMKLGFRLTSSLQAPELCDDSPRVGAVARIAFDVARQFKLPRAFTQSAAFYGTPLDDLIPVLKPSDMACAFGSGAAIVCISDKCSV